MSLPILSPPGKPAPSCSQRRRVAEPCTFKMSSAPGSELNRDGKDTQRGVQLTSSLLKCGFGEALAPNACLSCRAPFVPTTASPSGVPCAPCARSKGTSTSGGRWASSGQRPFSPCNTGASCTSLTRAGRMCGRSRPPAARPHLPSLHLQMPWSPCRPRPGRRWLRTARDWQPSAPREQPNKERCVPCLPRAHCPPCIIPLYRRAVFPPGFWSFSLL